MTESLSQKEFNQLIMEVALAACFKPNEEFLSEEQILARNYTPTESFGRSCIASLIDSGKIEFTRIDPVFPFDGNECSLFIKCPVKAGGNLDDYIYQLAKNIVDVLIDFELNSVYLKALNQEVLAGECVEYCEYYAQREQLPLVNPNHSNAKLRLLVLECDVDIINMLMWRAIKTLANNASPETKHIEFSDIIEITHNRYKYYKRFNAKLEGYKRPGTFKTSVMAEFIELFLADESAK